MKVSFKILVYISLSFFVTVCSASNTSFTNSKYNLKEEKKSEKKLQKPSKEIVLSYINRYWDICENSQRVGLTFDDQSIAEMTKILYFKKREDVEKEIADCRSRLVEEHKFINQIKYKGQLDMSRNIMLLYVTENPNILTTNNGEKHLLYTNYEAPYFYYTYQRLTWKLPNGKDTDKERYKIVLRVVKDEKGKPQLQIISDSIDESRRARD